MTNTIEPGREVASRPGTLLQVTGAVKDYPGQRALDHMDFELRRGEVHALLGENGAGKSTLIKAVAGVISLTAGTVVMDGVEVDMRNPHRAQSLGVSVVHQHGNLVPDLSVTENVLMVDGLGRRAGVLVDWRAAHRRVRELLDRVGLPDLDPRREVSTLGPHQSAMVAVAKALASNARVIILDEPDDRPSAGGGRHAVRPDAQADPRGHRVRLRDPPPRRGLQGVGPDHRHA